MNTQSRDQTPSGSEEACHGRSPDPLLERLDEILRRVAITDERFVGDDHVAYQSHGGMFKREIRQLMADVAIEYSGLNKPLKIRHTEINGRRAAVLEETPEEQRVVMQAFAGIAKRFGVGAEEKTP